MRKRRNQWISLMLCVCLAAGMMGGWIIEGKSLIAEAAQETAGVSEEIVEEAGQTETSGDSALIREEEPAEEPSGEEETSESETSEAESLSAGESAAEAESSSEEESTSEIEGSSAAEETTEEESLSGAESSPEGESASETESTEAAEATTEEEDPSGTESSPEGESLTETEASTEESSTEAESEAEEATETEEESAQEETEGENGLEEIAGDPSAQAGGASGKLSDFPGDIEILDEEGNVVPMDELEPGVDYRIHLKFWEPDGSDLFMRGATLEELKEWGLNEWGLSSEDLDDITNGGDGKWMYVPLGADVTATLLEDMELPPNVKVLPDGKGLLFLYEDGMSSCDVEFQGQLSEKPSMEDLDIVADSQTGHYKPNSSTEPHLRKEAGEYDSNEHIIPYTVTLTIPEEGEGWSAGSMFEDVFGVSGQSVLPDYVNDTLNVKVTKADGTEETITVNVEETLGEDGKKHLKFTFSEPIPAGAKVEIEYDLNVEKCVDDLQGSTKSFRVDNTATVTPPGESQEPLKDEAKQTVYFGSLEKSGWFNQGNFWGYENVINWYIQAYDPYGNLYTSEITEKLPDGMSFEDIVGVLFEYDSSNSSQRTNYVNPATLNQNKQKLWEELLTFMTDNGDGTVTFDFSKVPDSLRNQIFQDGGKGLKFHIMTKYDLPPEGESRFFQNKVSTTLPSEKKERTAEAHLNLGLPGIETKKEGDVQDGGKTLQYTVTVDVNPNISATPPALYGIIAGLLDRLYIQINENERVYFYTTEAINVTSVIATYPGDSGIEETWIFENSEEAKEGHKFGVYNVSCLGDSATGELKNNKLSFPFMQDTAIVLNPVEGKTSGGAAKISGSWPKDLADKQVKLVYTYTIDTTKTYFLDILTHHKTPFNGAETLWDYVQQTGDVIVYNLAQAGINSSSSYDDEDLNLIVPLTKEGEVNENIAEGMDPTITYSVYFQNGAENNSSLSREGASDIVFVDNYDPKLVYIPKTLKARREMPDGGKVEFTYHGTETWTSNEIRAKWADFKDDTGNSLEDDFHKQTSQYKYVFTYDMKAGPNFTSSSDQAKVEVNNTAKIAYTENGSPKETNPATSTEEFPTGALTKQATLEVAGKVSFFIELNEKAEKLSPGTPYLEVEDVAEQNGYLELEKESISVERYSASNGWETLAETDWSDSWSNPDTWMKKIQEGGNFKLRVPDEARLRVHYTYQLTELGKHHSGNIDVSNNVTVTGKQPMSYGIKETFGASQITAQGDSTPATISISKIDELTGKPLANGTFVLFVPNVNEETNDEAVKEAEKVGVSELQYEGKTLHPIEVASSNESGQAIMDWHFIRPNNTIYALLETSAPEGYQRLETPIYLTVRKNNTIDILNQGSLGDKVKIENGGIKIANPPVGDLSVTKTVTGKAGDKTKDWHFRVELSDKTITGTYGEMTFTNGIATFTLKDGQTKTATDLPPGITYKVTEEEANQDGYVTTSVGETGTILETGVAHVQFQNSKPDNLLQEPQPPQELLIVPDTGDPSHLLFWFALFSCSLLGLAMIRRRIR